MRSLCREVRVPVFSVVPKTSRMRNTASLCPSPSPQPCPGTHQPRAGGPGGAKPAVPFTYEFPATPADSWTQGEGDPVQPPVALHPCACTWWPVL